MQSDYIDLMFERRTWDRLLRYLLVGRKKARRIVKLTRALADEAADIEEEANVIIGLLRSSLGAVDAPPSTTGEDGKRRPVIHSLVLTDGPGKSLDVFIDHPDKPFSLQRQLGQFLKFIAEGNPGEPDGLIQYRTEKELLDYLTTTRSRTKSPRRYISKLVNSLRTELYDAGFDRDLIQRNSEGVRFRWRRRMPPPPAKRSPSSVFLA